MFRGKLVQARIKSENLRKSFYYNVPQTPYYFNGTNPYGENPSVNGDNRTYKSNQRTHDPKSSKPGRFGGNRRNREPKVRRGRPPSKKNTPHEKNEHKTHSAFSMSTSHWPPLPVPSASEEGKKLVAGYHGDFAKYHKDQFISIICALNNNNNNPNPKFETESPAILENGLIHSDLEILKPIPPGAVVEFLEAKQKSKGKSHKNPKNESPPVSGTTNVTADAKEPAEATSSPSPAATVWPAIDSSSVKTPPPPNHQSNKKAPPPKPRQTKPPISGPATNEKAQQQTPPPAVGSKSPTAGQQQKAKDQPLQQQQQPKSNTKHYPPKHQKKPPTHSESHSPNKMDTSSTKSTEKENPNTASVSNPKDNQSNISAAKENQGPQTKEKSEPISTPSYADIARSTTPTNTPSNSTISD